ncbi:hypothetical protein F7Q90_20050 [Pantoea stewartii subsp. stewartii]|nr:hypothetical protein F7Q90_20050 [Pantoea stewartii subsp. stewartii]
MHPDKKHNQLISDCAISPAACQQKYCDVLADSTAMKKALDRAMSEVIPIKMVYALTATLVHQIDRFNFELFGITFTAHWHLPLSSLSHLKWL